MFIAFLSRLRLIGAETFAGTSNVKTFNDLAYVGQQVGRGRKTAHAYIVTAKENFSFRSIGVEIAKESADREKAQELYEMCEFRLIGMSDNPLAFWAMYAQVLIALDIPTNSVWEHHRRGLYRLEKLTNLRGDPAGKFRPHVSYHDIRFGHSYSRPTDEFFRSFTFLAEQGDDPGGRADLPRMASDVEPLTFDFNRELLTKGY